MKHQILGFTIIITLLCSDCFCGCKHHRCIPDYDAASGMLANKSVNKIERRHKIRCIGSGFAMFNGPIRSMTLSFQIRGALSREELRRILVTSAQDILKTAEDIPNLDSCLYAPPFGMQNFDVILFVYNSKGGDLCDPDITVARLSDGVLTYKTNDPTNTIRTLNCYEETYEQAIQMLENQAML